MNPKHSFDAPYPMSLTKNSWKNIRPVPRVQHRSYSRCAFITLIESSAQASRRTPRALTADTLHAHASYPYPPPRHLPSAPSSDDCPALAISSCAFRMTSLASRAAPRSCGLAALLPRKQILSHHRVQDGAHTCACVRVCVCSCVRVCACACVYIYVRAYIRPCLNFYIIQLLQAPRVLRASTPCGSSRGRFWGSSRVFIEESLQRGALGEACCGPRISNGVDRGNGAASVAQPCNLIEEEGGARREGRGARLVLVFPAAEDKDDGRGWLGQVLHGEHLIVEGIDVLKCQAIHSDLLKGARGSRQSHG